MNSIFGAEMKDKRAVEIIDLTSDDDGEEDEDAIEIDYDDDVDETLIAEKYNETTTDEEEDAVDVDMAEIYPCQELDVGPEDFDIMRVLGRGGFGKVMQVKKNNGKDNGNIFAMKAIKKSLILRSQKDLDHTNTERKVLEIASHPFICNLFYAFQSSAKLYLILEFAKGGELFVLLEKEGALSEPEVIFYSAEILLALEHLHGNGIIYRDLKPENVLLDSEGHIKLTDFGLCKDEMFNSKSYTYCGTVEYMSPEMLLKKGHSFTTDWWAFGVLIYDMIAGITPFAGEDRQVTIDKILKSRLRFPKHVGENAQDLIKKLLRRTVSQRIGSKNGATEIKTHQFFGVVNWDNVIHKRVKPPFCPDQGLFDPQFTCLPPIDTPSSSISRADDYEEDPFEDFNYVSPILEAYNDENTQESSISTTQKSLPNNSSISSPTLLKTSSLQNWSFSPV